MNILCIIQARMGSTRLPNKVLMEAAGMPLLEYELKRAGLAARIDKIVVATTDNPEDDQIEALCNKIGVDCFRGSEEDVLDRYYQCSLKYPEYEAIVRITGDCPLIDPEVIDAVIGHFEKTGADLAANHVPGEEMYPDGVDIEVMKTSVLHEAAREAVLPSHREHADEYIFQNEKYRKVNFPAAQDWSHFRFTVDEPADFEVVKFIIENSKITDGYLEHIALLTKFPEIMMKNLHFKRNEAFQKSLTKDEEYREHLTTDN